MTRVFGISTNHGTDVRFNTRDIGTSNLDDKNWVFIAIAVVNEEMNRRPAGRANGIVYIRKEMPLVEG